MLVTFHSKNYYPITMFGDVALQLLQGMGLNPKVPGAIYADDVPQALWQLQQWLELQQAAAPEPETVTGLDTAAPPIGIKLRAVPLLEMLQEAAKAQHGISWD
jgi:hypothetical protein